MPSAKARESSALKQELGALRKQFPQILKERLQNRLGGILGGVW